jgi:hypothetical protein
MAQVVYSPAKMLPTRKTSSTPGKLWWNSFSGTPPSSALRKPKSFTTSGQRQ